MGAREELEELVSGPFASPEDAERAARAAEALAAYLRADQAAMAILKGGSVAGMEADEGSAFSSLTLHDAAERVLEEAGVPLHVKELGKRIKAHGWKHRRSVSRPDQINYQLAARLPRHSDVFVRIAPNTFALKRWGTSRAAQAPVKPRLGLFKGPGGAVGRSIGEHADEAASSSWR